MVLRWKELCIDVVDPRSGMTRFYAEAVGGTPTTPRDETDPGDVDGPPGGTIAMCPVPEARTVKHRVHLDVHTADVARLLDAGATVQRPPTPEERWTVLADPEGGEICAFTREADQVPAYRLYEVVVDAADAERIATWWAGRFGVEARNDGQHPWWWLEDIPGAPFEAFVFNPVPEPKTVKNRIHWDLYGDADDVLAAGATRLWDMPHWRVLADPEGNEFCVFAED